MKKKIVALFSMLCLCFAFLGFRIYLISIRPYGDVVSAQQTKTIQIGSSRGKIYDRNLEQMVDRQSKLIAAVTPSRMLLKEDEFKLQKNIEEKIEQGQPFSCEVKSEIQNELVRTFELPIRYTDSCACHLVGYTDKKNENGLAGIERAYDGILRKESGSLSVSFGVDAHGRALPGLDKTVNDLNYNSPGGVVLTIDRKIQQITEKALENSKIKSGCAIVMHVDSGELYAMSSIPTYDRNDLSKSINSDNSPFLNKALQSYSVGSVFKPIIAACALESGIIDESFQYECKGKIKVGDTEFTCYNHRSHGKQTLQQALSNSCNTYFINLLNNIDENYVLSVCRKLRLDQSLSLADGYSTVKGTIPNENELSLLGERANFAFGQGRLSAVPTTLAAAYHAIATGNYVEPTVIRGICTGGGLVKTAEPKQCVKIFSDKTVKKMRKMLKTVVKKSYEASSSGIISLAGKTGTAQSGIIKNGKEVCRTWFAGFFPSDNPHYIVVILNEDGSSGVEDCAPVFKEISENIALSQ